MDVYEARERLGGTPEATIPQARIEAADARAEIEAILRPALEAGRLTVKLGAALGTNLRLDELRSRADAVLLAVGLGRTTGLDGPKPAQVLDATRFLSAIKDGRTTEVEGRVAVLGAGNTAMDAASSALRLGASDVSVVYRRSFAQMPAWKEELDEFLVRGGNVLTLSQPTGYQADETGRLTGLRRGAHRARRAGLERAARPARAPRDGERRAGGPGHRSAGPGSGGAGTRGAREGRE